MIKKATAHFFLFLLLSITLLFAELSFAQSNQERADNLRENINLAQKDTNTVNSINSLVKVLLEINQNREGLEWAERGLDLADEIDYASGKQSLLIHKADHLLQIGEYEDALSTLDQAEELDYNSERYFQLLNIRAGTYLRMNNPMISIEIFREMEAIADSTDNLDQLSTVKNNMAYAYGEIGEEDETIRLYTEALEISEELDNKPKVAIALNNIGFLFQRSGDFEQAENYLLRSENLSKEINLLSNLVRTYTNLGNVHKDLGELDQAESYHKQALEVYEEQGNPRGIIQTIYNLGNIEIERENYDLANSLFIEGYEKSSDINLLMGVYYNAEGMGRLGRFTGRYDSSIEWLNRALSAAEQLNINDSKLHVFDLFYQTYKAAENYPEALSWIERYNTLNDSLRDEESERLTTQYEAQLGMRESLQQNELLQAQQLQQEAQLNSQQWIIVSAIGGVLFLLVIGGFLILNSKRSARANKLLTRKNIELESLNQTINHQKKEQENSNLVKTKLFGIVAHDLRGPVNAMQSLLYLLREHDLSKKELDELTADMENSITENSTLMDNLLGWAKSQMDGLEVAKQTFNLRMCVRAVTENFTTRCREKDIQVVIDIPEDQEMHADYDMIKLIIRNLFANAIKFSKPNSTITIVSKSDEHSIQISVIDEGVGIPEEHKPKIFKSIHFTSNGTDNEQGSGLGLNLCKEFVESHEGEIWFQSEVNKGTTFAFEIPNEKNKIEQEVAENQKEL
ncbi:MAG: tetratricopeptide repeat-containing sensor histidine kinase [Balneolaceae bacterium]